MRLAVLCLTALLISLMGDAPALAQTAASGKPRIEWEVVLDTRDWDLVPAERLYKAGEPYPLEGHTLAVLRQRAKEPA